MAWRKPTMPFFVQDREHLRLSGECRLRAGFAPPASSSVRSQWLENGMGSEALCQHPLLTILNARAAGQRCATSHVRDVAPPTKQCGAFLSLASTSTSIL